MTQSLVTAGDDEHDRTEQQGRNRWETVTDQLRNDDRGGGTTTKQGKDKEQRTMTEQGNDDRGGE